MMENKYCRALAELRSKPAHELKEVGDQWRTPDLLFWGINAMFGPLVLDLFADDSNAKCPAWYTAEDNALTQDWSERLAELGGAGFGNPPYEGLSAFYGKDSDRILEPGEIMVAYGHARKGWSVRFSH